MDLREFQVVRQEFVTSQDVVRLTFNKGRMYVNSYALSQFTEEDYIRILVDDRLKSIVILPMKNQVKDSFRWCGGVKKRKPRHMRCLPLYYLVYRMMKWDLDARYRIDGGIEDYGEQRVLYFGLGDAVCFQREGAVGECGQASVRQYVPADWNERYGLPMMEYEGRQDIKTFDGVAVFDVELRQDERVRGKLMEISETGDRKESYNGK